MPFSFTPAQVASAGMAVQGGNVPGVPLQDNAPVSNSPIIFIRELGKEKSVNAYLQILLILVATLFIAASAVLFAYSKYLASSIDSKKAEITLKDSSFKDYSFEDMRRLSVRFSALSSLLSAYVSVRSPLRFLEDVIEKQVTITEFVLTKKDEAYIVNFTAITGNYRSLIQQLEALHLTQYQKIAPTSRLDSYSDSLSSIEVKVTTPVFVQGVLPDEIVFLQQPPVAEAATSAEVIVQASSTPQ